MPPYELESASVSERNDIASKDAEVPYRRRYVRVSVATEISYTREGNDIPKVGSSSDLGGGGVRLATDEDLPLGTVLMLRFPLPGLDRDVVVRGRIVLSFYNAEDKRFMHGIAFTSIDPRDQEEIVRYVAAEVQRQAVRDESPPD
jgi:c-di-GMP-binding flagellar brake protein YcgR